MIQLIQYSIRFLVLVILQSLILNQLEIGFGIQFMAYPLFILLLPFEISTIYLLSLAFCMGVIIDVISNTYGLHTSSLLLFAYIRPFIFKKFSSREGYDNLKIPSINDMGSRWFTFVYGTLLLLHHLWFFTLEMFRIDNLLFILQKTLLSLPFSFLVSILVQSLLVSKTKER
jgi:hypothetical protein